MECPRCQHRFAEHDPSVPAGVCPGCGIAWEKWLARQDTQAAVAEAGQQADQALELGDDGDMRLGRRLLRYFLFVPSNRHESVFWGHALLYALFFCWGWSFILGGIDAAGIHGSWLHAPNLAFHEYGHVAFSPFGHTAMLLGGSLFQVLLPLGLGLAFAIWQRDNFAAALMLWWCGQNFIDVAPYVADAPRRLLPLVGGGPEVHDWGQLLGQAGWLEQAPLLAAWCFGLGALLMVLSNVWGAALLLIELEGRGVIKRAL